jgi:NDP-sugar pyrophosphorylase family protein
MLIHKTPTVLITTSGTGSRLGELTSYTNKSLVRVGCKPALSYIIESYPNAHFVITLGYKGDLVKQYIEVAHPGVDVTYVTVNNYEGPGSSLVHSMLAARRYLQEPFIFHAGDTIVSPPSTDVAYNWVAAGPKADSSVYRTLVVKHLRTGTKLVSVAEKGSLFPAPSHIGVVGIYEYDSFWKEAEALACAAADSSLSDAHVINAMLSAGAEFAVLGGCNDWLDIGNAHSLEEARACIPDRMDNLDKVDQSVYIVGDRVVKFFSEEKSNRNRVERANMLAGVIPDILGSTKNFFSYRKAEGSLLDSSMYPYEMEDFLAWCKECLWIPLNPQPPDIQPLCTKFYKAKTLSRIADFYDKAHVADTSESINGILADSLACYLNDLDWDRVTSGIATERFHGDLHFSNVFSTNEGYKLIDWREDFAGELGYGDVYYDLAKLNHGMIVSHTIVKNNLFSIENTPGGIYYDMCRPHRLVACQKEFYSFLEKEGYDVWKVDVITALIFLNICSLHHSPYDMFLYYLGKDMLRQEVS